ncbi:pyroglutamyl-peptidase I [Nesterenkonia sp. MY13]|uniref:Pyroglutamyl-peptidase I n=1 Tax=Nesterenkonia sedimenti TaxID=1463632 RepID=A0A7X8YCY9_9MICC|nr:pyroglutamyl-peptidase I [Nesterenkonia sedimenti]NLS08831.1 pyroglutamyl-peptidase I [Nesterenkonia sedimenti]
MKRVLISGFEPFGGMDYNPSWDVAEQLQKTHTGAEVHAVRLPVEFGTAAETLLQHAEALQPDLIIATGLAGGTDAVRLERVGLNLRDARIPDNSGAQPVDEAIDDDGAAALFSTLRLKAAHARIKEAGIPVQLSLSAGSFVCNDVLYSLMAAVARMQTPVPAGFVHLPDLRDPAVSLTTEQSVEALGILIEESLAPEPDATIIGGTLH